MSIEDKLDVCEKASKKVPRTEIMAKYRSGKPTVGDIISKMNNLKVLDEVFPSVVCRSQLKQQNQ